MSRPCRESPSLIRFRSAKSVSAFREYDGVERLLADAVVGNHKYKEALLHYRCCSRDFRDAVDSAIGMWCADFSQMQLHWLDLCRERGCMAQDCEEAFRVAVALERIVTRAFGPSALSATTLSKLNNIDVCAYLSILARRCVLCGGKMTTAVSAQDAEDARSVPPMYTHAHASCQRKHMVVVTDGVSPVRSVESREVSREVAAVVAFPPDGKAIDRKTALPLLSKWFRVVAQPRFALPISVWLRPHPLVKDDATLYGALGVTRADVLGAVEMHDQRVSQQTHDAMERNRRVQKRAREISDAYVAELHVWMGKGKTRWRSLDALSAFHENALHSLNFDALLGPLARRVPTSRSLYVMCHSIFLFGRTLDLMPRKASPALVEWAVNSATLSKIFADTASEILYVDENMVDLAVENEAEAFASAFSMVDSLEPRDLRRLQTRPTNDGASLEDQPYVVETWVRIRGVKRLASFTMTLSELCKLKYLVWDDLHPSLRTRLHCVPDKEKVLFHSGELSSTVADYLFALLQACLSEGAGLARAVALRLIVPYEVFRDLLDDVYQEAPLVA